MYRCDIWLKRSGTNLAEDPRARGDPREIQSGPPGKAYGHGHFAFLCFIFIGICIIIMFRRLAVKTAIIE